MNNFDVIIVGSGLGGLTAGAKLAGDGKKVLVLEQHSIPGGCATTFKRKDFLMEVGLHEMDGLDKKDPKNEIFKALGVFNHVDFLKTPQFYRFINNRVDLVIPESMRDAFEKLADRFPKEKKGIKKFFKTINGIRNEVNRLPLERLRIAFLLPLFPFLFPYLSRHGHKTVGSFLDAIVADEDLKLILQANIQYYHDDPNTMSLIYFSAAQASYFNGGGHYIKGGSYKLSEYLTQVIEKNGGEILCNSLVTDIVTRNKKAVGVKFRKSGDHNGAETGTAFADAIIANAAIPNVAEMLPAREQRLLNRRITKLERSCALLSIYIGFKKPVSALGHRHYSTFVYHESVKKLSDVVTNFRGDFSTRNFVFVDYSQIDACLAPEGKSFGVVCTVDYLSDWENLSAQAYRKKKKQVAQVFFSRLERLVPGITAEIERYEVGTSKTVQRYTLNPGGTAYGYAQIPKQAGLFRLPVESVVKNLFFASAWAFPGGGFTGAILSGWYCARKVCKFLEKH